MGNCAAAGVGNLTPPLLWGFYNRRVLGSFPPPHSTKSIKSVHIKVCTFVCAFGLPRASVLYHVWWGARKLQGEMLVSPVQAYLDLIALGGRGEEAAKSIMGQVLKW